MDLTRNHYQRNSSWNAPYTFSGKEKDVETGYGYVKKLRFFSSLAFGNEKQVFHYAHCLRRFGARYYDSGLSIWLSVDPMSDKYPSMSPYNYCANNPVILVDPDGRELDVSGNIEKAKNDLKSIVLNQANANRIIVDDNSGTVTVNREGLLQEDIDAGLQCIIDMVDAPEKFLYEVSDNAHVVIDGMNPNTFESEGDTQANIDITRDDNGLINASLNGKDANGKNTYRPSSNYQGQVSIAESENYSVSWDGVQNNGRRSVIFHELRENYYRTHFGYDFRPNSSNNNYGAHYRATRDEKKYYYLNGTPGSATYSH